MAAARRTFSLKMSTLTSATPDDVLARVRRPETWPHWVPEITSMESSGEVMAGDTLRGRASMLGFGVDGHGSVTEVSAGRFEQEVVVGVRMTASYEVRSAEHGAVVHHELTVAAPHGPVGAVLSLLLRWRLKRMQRRLLRNLVEQVESAQARA
jgi:hypothetical protein